MKRLLVTGGSGELGRVVSRRAEPRWQVSATYLTNPQVGGGDPVQADLRSPDDTMRLVREIRPDVIVHAAASERTPDMENTNRLAALHIGQASTEVGARLIALSTDLIFDGTSPPYSELAPPTPTSNYGSVKAENEKHLLRSKSSLVIRTSLIYDLRPDAHQIRWMLRLISEGRRVPLFVDEIRQPIWASDLADAILELADGDVTGILNVAGPERLSRWEFGAALLSAYGYDADQTVDKVRAAEVAPDRPRDCTLDLTRMDGLLTTQIKPVGEVLRRTGPQTAV